MYFAKKSILQLKPLLQPFLLVYASLFTLFYFVLVLADQWNWPIAYFTRDPAATFNSRPFVGMISNIGIMFWCFTAAICLFTATVFKDINVKYTKFYVFSGLLTLILMFDDLFMVHDKLLPHYFQIPEIAIYLAYLGIIIIYFLMYWKIILRTEYMIILFACMFFGASILADIFFLNKGMQFLIEDGLKLFGIVTWFLYFVRTCLNASKIEKLV